MATGPLVLVDEPGERIRRLTLHWPETRNALSNTLYCQLFDALHAHDADPDVHVMCVRGAGSCFLRDTT